MLRLKRRECGINNEITKGAVLHHNDNIQGVFRCATTIFITSDYNDIIFHKIIF